MVTAVRIMIRELIEYVTSPFFVSASALCTAVFAYAYLVMSVLPYSGFLAMTLVEGVNDDNAGYYAGFIISSYMVGLTISGYHSGKLADVYGRKTVLCLGLAWSSIFSLWFGLSTSYPMALLSRFLLGIGGGVLGGIKTQATEISHGDEALEVQSVALILSTYGSSMLFAPVVSGLLADPVRQYPFLWTKLNEEEDDALVGHGVHLHRFLSKYPFFLANFMGSIICLASLLILLIFLEETLPNTRHPKHMVGDLLICFRCLFLSSTQSDLNHVNLSCESTEKNEKKSMKESRHETLQLLEEECPGYGAVGASDITESTDLGSMDDDLCEELFELERSSLASAIYDSVSGFDVAGVGGFALASTLQSRRRFSVSVVKRASTVHIGNQQLQSRKRLSLSASRRAGSVHIGSQQKLDRFRTRSMVPQHQSKAESKPLLDGVENGEKVDIPGEATIALLWASKKMRHHLLVYWLETFAIQATEESIPLFLMSTRGGLGLSAVAIGSVLSITGGIYTRVEYFVYAFIVNAFGLHGSMKLGVMFTWPWIASIPLVLWFNTQGATFVGSVDKNHSASDEAGDLAEDYHAPAQAFTLHSINGSEENRAYGNLSWFALIYLTIVVTVARLLGATFLASSILLMNRAVLPSHRATMNGFCTQGAGVARALAPPFAGMLVASCLSSELFPDPWEGAAVMFCVLASLGSFAMVAAISLDDDNGL